MSVNNRINVLWLDDDLLSLTKGKTPERTRLQPWLRWFKKNEHRIKLLEASTIKDFADILKSREALQSADDDYLHVLLIDLMLRGGSMLPETFGDLEFPDEKVIPMEAGMQLVKLIRESKAPSWLTKHANRKIVILTTLTDAKSTITDHLKSDGTVDIIYKKLEVDGSEQMIPSKDFIEYFSTVSCD